MTAAAPSSIAVLTPEALTALVRAATIEALDARLPGLEDRMRLDWNRRADATQLVTRKEAADMLRISMRELGRLVKAGDLRLKPVRVGRRAVRFRRSEVEAVIRNGA